MEGGMPVVVLERLSLPPPSAAAKNESGEGLEGGVPRARGRSLLACGRNSAWSGIRAVAGVLRAAQQDIGSVLAGAAVK